MHPIVKQTYQDLMADLARLPGEIKAAQIELTATKLELGTHEASAKAIADTLPTRGNNEAERKANKVSDLQTNEAYQVHNQAAIACRRSIVYQTDEIANLERQFNAVRYQAKLHAEYMALLANDTTAQDISFNMDAAGKSAAQIDRVNGSNGHMTAQDAAEAGL